MYRLNSDFASCLNDVFHRKRKLWIVHCIQLSCSLNLLSPGTLPQSHFAFDFEAHGSVIFGRSPFVWFVCCFFMIKFKLCIFCWKSTEVMLFCASYQEARAVNCLIIGDTNFHHLVKVVSARFSPLKLINILWRFLLKQLPLKLSPISFSTYGRVLPETMTILIAANGDFLPAAFFSHVFHLTALFLPPLPLFLPLPPLFLHFLPSFYQCGFMNSYFYPIYYILLSLLTLIVKLSSIWLNFNGLGVTDFKTRTSERNV